MEITLDNIECYLDFTNVENWNLNWIEPVFIGAYKAYLEDKGLAPSIRNSYLNRMLASDYTDGKSYSPIENIKTRAEIEQIANHLASIMLQNFSAYSKEDKEDLRDYLRYLFTEMMNNVIDHSQSSVGGFAMAQYFPQKERIQFVVADRGVGFLHNVQLKEDIDNEGEAIKKALQKGFTATQATMYGSERNAGFGLYAMREILKLTGGKFVIVSNDTVFRSDGLHEHIKKLSIPYKGVLVAFDFYAPEINLTMEEILRGYIWFNDDEDDDFY